MRNNVLGYTSEGYRYKSENLRQFAEKLLSDRITLRQPGTRADIRSQLTDFCADVHYQGVVLPWLACPEEIATLFDRFSDDDLSDTVRMGIVESLARSACEAGEEMLAKIGRSKETPETLRKAAWRGLRRSKRKREKKEHVDA